MAYAYYDCHNLTGSPVCGEKVTNMRETYRLCYNLTGSPVCGNNVTIMYMTYYSCENLTGSPVCGDNVTDMYSTYCRCYNLTGSPICGRNVVNMMSTYFNCSNLKSNAYFYSPNITNMMNCFYNAYNKRIYLPENSTSLNTALISDTTSMVGTDITWTNDMTTNKCYYNTSYNMYIYPVSNVADARVRNGD